MSLRPGEYVTFWQYLTEKFIAKGTDISTSYARHHVLTLVSLIIIPLIILALLNLYVSRNINVAMDENALSKKHT